MQKLCAATTCRLNWLAQGEGPMFGGEKPYAAIETYITGAGNRPRVSRQRKLPPTIIPDARALIAYRVDGDSMEPIVRPGQTVIALRGTQAESGELAYVELRDGDRTFKRYIEEENRVILQPVNTARKARTVLKREIRRALKVWGVLF